MGYITVVLVIFAVIFGSIMFNASDIANNASNSPVEAKQAATVDYCSVPSESEVITFDGPQDNSTKCPDGPNGKYLDGDDAPRHDFSGQTTYKLIRKNVPLNIEFFEGNSNHSDEAKDINIQADIPGYRLYFPEISGEIKVSEKIQSRTRACREEDNGNTDLLYFMDYGLVFAMILKDGNPVQVQGTDTQGNAKTFYLTDIFQDSKRAPVPELGFKCSESRTQTPLGVVVPTQTMSDKNKELQLGYFTFGNAAAQGVTNGWNDTCKPAIYLYSKEKMMVNVKVMPYGYLTYTDPLYNLITGWTVDVSPNGTLSTNYNPQPKTYPYLYYESKIKDEIVKKPEKGYVVPFNELENLYNELLPKLGLDSTQSKDFIDYWKKALPYSPYYFVGVMDKQNIDEMEPLQITPAPDFINRVRVYFERLEKPITVEAPDLTEYQSSTNNYTLKMVEWGGLVKNDPNHPFTCSQ